MAAVRRRCRGCRSDRIHPILAETAGATPEHYPLLFAAVRTAAIDCIRSHARRLKREQAFYDGGPCENRPWFEPSIEERERADLLQAALRELPEEQRETLVLHIWGDLTFAQISDILSLSINTVSARYRYALQALRRSYNPNTYERVLSLKRNCAPSGLRHSLARYNALSRANSRPDRGCSRK